MIVDVLLVFVNSIIEGGIVAWGIGRILTPRFSKIKNFLLFLLFYIAIPILTYMWDSPFRPIACMATTIPAILFLFRETISRKLLVFVIVFSGMGIIDGLLSCVTYFLFGFALTNRLEYLPIRQFTVIVFCALFFVFLASIGELFKKRISKISQKYIKQLLLFPFSQFVFLLGNFAAANVMYNPVMYIIVIVSCLFSCVSIVYLFKTMNDIIQATELESKNQNLQQQQVLQFEHYNALQLQIEQTGKMRHDMANQLQTIQILLEQSRYDEAVECASQIQNHFEDNALAIFCENPIVNAVLHNKERFAWSNGIKLIAEMNIGSETAIDNLDLMSLLLNLLDNAIESCLDLSQTVSRTISISDKQQAGMYVVTMINPKLITIRFDESTPPETAKKNKQVHGIGTKIIADIAQKYDGAVSYQDSGDSLTTIVGLRYR